MYIYELTSNGESQNSDPGQHRESREWVAFRAASGRGSGDAERLSDTPTFSLGYGDKDEGIQFQAVQKKGADKPSKLGLVFPCICLHRAAGVTFLKLTTSGTLLLKTLQ